MNEDNEPATSAAEPETRWRGVFFQEAQTDIRWAKEQGWSVVQWSVILLAAIFTAAAAMKMETVVYRILVLAEAIFATGYLWSLNRFAKRAREKVDNLVSPLPPALVYPKRKECEPNAGWIRKFLYCDIHHVKYFLLQVLIIWIVAAVVWCGVANPCPPPPTTR